MGRVRDIGKRRIGLGNHLGRADVWGIPGRVTVSDECHVIVETGRAAAGCIDTGFRLHPGNHEVSYSPRLQIIMERCFVETVARLLVDDRFAGEWCDRWMNLPTWFTTHHWSVGRVVVLDKDNR